MYVEYNCVLFHIDCLSAQRCNQVNVDDHGNAKFEFENFRLEI